MTLATTSAHRSASEVLGWSRTTIEPVLRAAVRRLPDSMLHLAGYHLGWWDATGEPCRAPAGKAIRPALTLLSAQAVGGAPEATVGAAVAVELVHNFSLVHDDVMDADEMRRHRPTTWSVFGVNQAILAGDVILAAAFQALAATGAPACTASAVDVLAQCVSALCEGQSADLSFEERNDVDTGEYLTMAWGKTSALLGTSCELGAMLAGGDEQQRKALRDFGEHLGLTFQLIDDLLGIWGDPAVTGKPAGADLVRRKQSYPVVSALRAGGPAAAELAERYAQPEAFTPEQVTEVALLVERAGGREATQRHAREQFADALAALEAAHLDEQAKSELLVLAELVTRRNS
ncbi:family 2 encapsulin nanocompartment cargo protein polyprenyl transferase [Saccharopolyspora sp. NPDC003752]